MLNRAVASAPSAFAGEELPVQVNIWPFGGVGGICLLTGSGATVDAAKAVGQRLGERAKAVGITSVVFDRGGFKFHGRVAGVANGARDAGLEF